MESSSGASRVGGVCLPEAKKPAGTHKKPAEAKITLNGVCSRRGQETKKMPIF